MIIRYGFLQARKRHESPLDGFREKTFRFLMAVPEAREAGIALLCTPLEVEAGGDMDFVASGFSGSKTGTHFVLGSFWNGEQRHMIYVDHLFSGSERRTHSSYVRRFRNREQRIHGFGRSCF